MFDARLSVYRVAKQHATFTFVAAYSEEHAEQIARQLTDEAYDGNPQFSVSQVTSADQLPPEWRDELPWTEPGKEHLYRELTCAQIAGAAPTSHDPDEQHAINQQLHGSVILRSPRTESEQELYVRFGVLCTSEGIYFTALKPIPIQLEPFYVCHALRADPPAPTTDT